MRFGNLVVLSGADPAIRKDGRLRRMWRCKCDCGNTIVAEHYNLLCGNTKSCGCQKRRKVEDLTDKKYGRLTVMEFAGTRIFGDGQSKSVWKCMCECGNEIIASASNLKSGYVRSCGCLKRETTVNRFLKPLDGQRFGKLTVIQRVENSTSGKVRYLCSCDCGGMTIACADSLRKGATSSCGCIKSVGESKINQWLVDHNVRFKQQYTDDNILFSNGHKPIFDFAIFDSAGSLLCLIEYNGIQHYQTGYGWNDESHYTENVQRDKEKIEQCGIAGYSLSIIPYTMLDNIDKAMLNIDKVFHICSQPQKENAASGIGEQIGSSDTSMFPIHT